MRPLSKKRQSIEREMIATYRQIESDRGMMCECCQSSNFEHSHNYPRNPFIWLIPNENNITLLCRRHHQAFENNMLWEFKDDKIFRHMKWQYENEPDQFRATSMRQHLNGKLSGAIENAELWGATLPGWVEELLNETQF